MLSSIVEIFLNLEGNDDFLESVTGCGFYNPAVFRKAASILERTGINAPARVAAFHRLIARLDDAKKRVVRFLAAPPCACSTVTDGFSMRVFVRSGGGDDLRMSAMWPWAIFLMSS